jgi:hypothetical protein
MGMTPRYSAVVGFFFLAAGLLIAVGPVGAEGVTVALTPTTQEVEPGAIFSLDMTITEAGSPFNAFYAIVGWDPAALTPVSHAEGTLMTSACSNRFYKFAQGADTDTIGDGLLCSGVSVTGPGQIFHFEFQASETPQVTEVQFLPGLEFYKGGLFVRPAVSTDALIGIGVPVDVGSRGVTGKLALRAVPNPARGQAVFAIECDRPGSRRLEIVDLRGRVVRRLDDSVGTAGPRRVTWDGRDAAGKEVPAGVYLVTLEVGGRRVSSRVSLLR